MVLESQKVSECLVAYFVSGNLLSKQLKHWWETSPNKAFKTDSQRMAFFIPSLRFVFKVAWLNFVVALLTT